MLCLRRLDDLPRGKEKLSLRSKSIARFGVGPCIARDSLAPSFRSSLELLSRRSITASMSLSRLTFEITCSWLSIPSSFAHYYAQISHVKWLYPNENNCSENLFLKPFFPSLFHTQGSKKDTRKLIGHGSRRFFSIKKELTNAVYGKSLFCS